jgi:putative oxidoreductase
MTLLHKIENWGNNHHPAWMDFVRIALGAFLIYKGVDFLMNMSVLIGLMGSGINSENFTLILLGHGIVFTHIIGGILLLAGVLTRFASLIQLPILIGALILLNFAPAATRPYADVLITILVFLLLVYFLIAGNGPYSIKFDNEHQKEKTWKFEN